MFIAQGQGLIGGVSTPTPRLIQCSRSPFTHSSYSLLDMINQHRVDRLSLAQSQCYRVSHWMFFRSLCQWLVLTGLGIAVELTFGLGCMPTMAEPSPAAVRGNANPVLSSADRLVERGLSKAITGDWQGAIADYTLAIQQNPNFAAAYNNRGIAYRQLGQHQQAIADYTQAILLTPNNAELFNNRAIAHLSLGQRQMAISDFTTAISLNPNYARAHYGRGTVRRQVNDHQGAMADFDRAIQIDPTYADAYYGRGLYRQALGDRPAALQDFQRAADLYNAAGNTRRYQETLERITSLRRGL